MYQSSTQTLVNCYKNSDWLVYIVKKASPNYFSSKADKLGVNIKLAVLMYVLKEYVPKVSCGTSVKGRTTVDFIVLNESVISTCK